MSSGTLGFPDEPDRNSVTAAGMRSYLLKLLALQATEQRRQKRDSQPQTWVSSAHLWILTPTASKSVLNRFAAQPEQSGIYSLPVGLQTHLVILHQLPKLGEISSPLQSQIEGLSLTQLEALGEAVLDLATLQDLINWLKDNASS